MMGRRMREGCVVMICRDFLRRRSRVEEMARIVCGRYKAENIMAISLLLQSYKIAMLAVLYTHSHTQQTSAARNPRQTPLKMRQRAEDMKARQNRPVSSPSRHPPGLMGLATPHLRHLGKGPYNSHY